MGVGRTPERQYTALSSRPARASHKLFQVSFTFEHLRQSMDQPAFCTRTRATARELLANTKRRYTTKCFTIKSFLLTCSTVVCRHHCPQDGPINKAQHLVLRTSIRLFSVSCQHSKHVGPISRTRGDRWKHPFRMHRLFNSARAGEREGKTPVAPLDNSSIRNEALIYCIG